MKEILTKLKKAIEWLVYGLALVGGAFLFAFFSKGNNREMYQKAKEVKKEVQKKVEIERKKTKKIRENIKKRQKIDKKLSEKLKKHFRVFLIVVLFAGLLTGAAVADGQLDIENLKIPDDYDTLLAQYKEMALIAIQYQQLYREAEADLQEMLATVERLQKLIETQQEIIDQLLKSNRSGLDIFTGVNFIPLDPLHSGLILGVNWKF